MDLQHVLQSVNLRYLTGSAIYPVDLFRVKVIAKDVPVFLAQMGS